MPYHVKPPAASTTPVKRVELARSFDWATSTHSYISLMRMLLAWSGGNVQQALAAYNAGQANWQVGLGHADHILSMAGQG
jgi:hypothetical protein